MDFQNFSRTRDQVEPVIDGVCLVGCGEVLLHARFQDLVRFAADRKLWTGHPSNGYQIFDPEAVR